MYIYTLTEHFIRNTYTATHSCNHLTIISSGGSSMTNLEANGLQLSGMSRKLRLKGAQTHQNWSDEVWKNLARSDESLFLLRHIDSRVRIWHQKNHGLCHGSSWLVSMVQAGGGVVKVWGILSRHNLDHLIQSIIAWTPMSSPMTFPLTGSKSSRKALGCGWNCSWRFCSWTRTSNECFRHLVESVPWRFEAVLEQRETFPVLLQCS